MKFCVLGSGSVGNAMWAATDTTELLIDAGLSCRETERRLAEIGTDLAAIKGICISHEHADHTKGLNRIHKKFGTPLYGNSGTIEAVMQSRNAFTCRWNVFVTGQSFMIGDIRLTPFAVPHDAYEPVGFILEAEERRIGIVTDAGLISDQVRERLSDCHVIAIESNYDETLLMAANRPRYLKERIRGRQGHLSNEMAAQTIREAGRRQLECAFLVHLSEQCNQPELAAHTSRRMLTEQGAAHVRVELTYADRVSHLWTCPAAAKPDPLLDDLPLFAPEP